MELLKLSDQANTQVRPEMLRILGIHDVIYSDLPNIISKCSKINRDLQTTHYSMERISNDLPRLYGNFKALFKNCEDSHNKMMDIHTVASKSLNLKILQKKLNDQKKQMMIFNRLFQQYSKEYGVKFPNFYEETDKVLGDSEYFYNRNTNVSDTYKISDNDDIEKVKATLKTYFNEKPEQVEKKIFTYIDNDNDKNIYRIYVDKSGDDKVIISHEKLKKEEEKK